MSSFKRGRIYWYKFMWSGAMIRESTRQTNQNTARQMEAAHRASLAKGEVGIREKKTAPTLVDFITQRFEPWAEASTSAKTWLDYYRPGIRTIQAYKPLGILFLCINAAGKVLNVPRLALTCIRSNTGAGNGRAGMGRLLPANDLGLPTRMVPIANNAGELSRKNGSVAHGA